VKRVKWVAILCAIALLVAMLCLPLWWYHTAEEGEIRTFALPAGSYSSSSGPIAIDLAPDFAVKGVTCEYLGTTTAAGQRLFFRFEKASVDLKVSTGNAPLATAGLRYELYGGNGHRVGEGTLRLEHDLGMNETALTTIHDARINQAQKIAIYRDGEK
jgi:hypothetical protein